MYKTEFYRRLSPISLQFDHLPTYENSLCGDPRGYACGKSRHLLPEPVQPVALPVYSAMDHSIDFLSLMFRRAQPGVSVGSIRLEVQWSVRHCTPKCCALKPVGPNGSMMPAPLRRVSASPSKASSGGMQDVHEQRLAPTAENKRLLAEALPLRYKTLIPHSKAHRGREPNPLPELHPL